MEEEEEEKFVNLEIEDGSRHRKGNWIINNSRQKHSWRETHELAGAFTFPQKLYQDNRVFFQVPPWFRLK